MLSAAWARKKGKQLTQNTNRKEIIPIVADSRINFSVISVIIEYTK